MRTRSPRNGYETELEEFGREIEMGRAVPGGRGAGRGCSRGGDAPFREAGEFVILTAFKSGGEKREPLAACNRYQSRTVMLLWRNW